MRSSPFHALTSLFSLVAVRVCLLLHMSLVNASVCGVSLTSSFISSASQSLLSLFFLACLCLSSSVLGSSLSTRSAGDTAFVSLSCVSVVDTPQRGGVLCPRLSSHASSLLASFCPPSFLFSGRPSLSAASHNRPPRQRTGLRTESWRTSRCEKTLCHRLLFARESHITRSSGFARMEERFLRSSCLLSERIHSCGSKGERRTVPHSTSMSAGCSGIFSEKLPKKFSERLLPLRLSVTSVQEDKRHFEESASFAPASGFASPASPSTSLAPFPSFLLSLSACASLPPSISSSSTQASSPSPSSSSTLSSSFSSSSLPASSPASPSRSSASASPSSSVSSVAPPLASAVPSRGVVFILGPTGVGKTRLSVEVALALQRRGQAAEIVSADSMQVYKGCDIATAKASVEEQKQVPHHLLDICDVDSHFSVLRFLQLATQTIEALHARGVLPIVVGGTQLYLQHLLWRSLLDRYLHEDLESEMQDKSSGSCSPLDRFSTETLYAELKKLDPERAAHLHPRDKRRIIRSIETTQSTGVPHSELMRREREASIREGLRYPSCILWLDCRDEAVHRRRLEKRVEQMLQAGLLQECEWLLDTLGLYEGRGEGARVSDSTAPEEGAKEAGREPEKKRVKTTAERGVSSDGNATAATVPGDAKGDTTLVETSGDSACEDRASRKAEPAAGGETRLPGVLQSIGYKEFIPFLLHQRQKQRQQTPTASTSASTGSSSCSSSSTLSDSSSCRFGCPAGTLCPPTLASAAACLVTRSCQYAKKQRRWIVNKFLLRQQHLPLYLLDTSHAENEQAWHDETHEPAIRIVHEFLNNKPFTEDHPHAAAAHLSEAEKAKRERLKALSGQASGVASTVGKDPWVDGGLNRPRTCTLCNRTCIGETDWLDHVKSKAHRARTKKENAGKKDLDNTEEQETKAIEVSISANEKSEC
ncbi:tRNA dimethylallyltransferase [Toxoplasma gondii VAND]|uniref:tRNA dimethylallyltransferase n=1 Tax=Toxoplasma gondii VAND TaxID=933077 RepID=A0A086QAP1_TOXGO|nr:tRNA dimethylallyltransferase [Toxoplasma gondii VAND]